MKNEMEAMTFSSSSSSSSVRKSLTIVEWFGGLFKVSYTPIFNDISCQQQKVVFWLLK